MKRNKVLATGLGLVLALAGAFGLAACSSGGGDTSGGATSQAADSEPAEETVDVAEDLENARQVIADTLAEEPNWGQIMLASDVDYPTEKYGLLVVPYSYSDASERVQGTITITDGKYTIDAVSAATGKTWRIDQDGKITEVTK